MTTCFMDYGNSELLDVLRFTSMVVLILKQECGVEDENTQ